MLHDDAVSLRGLFLIDKEGVVRHQLVNDKPLGRSVEEAIRLVNRAESTSVTTLQRYSLRLRRAALTLAFVLLRRVLRANNQA